MNSLSPSPAPDPAARGRVLAVLVAHNGSPFIARTLAAISALTTRPDWVIAVDAGSTDDTLDLLRAPGSPVNEIIKVPARTGFATAVHAGVDAAGASDWIWVLHDDCAPEPDCLAALLDAGDLQTSAGVLGPKVLGWDEPRRLLEVGVSIGRSGRRHTGLEPHEQDQGQYDGERDVLAVGSPGLLVRRETWDALGGFDKAIRLFREDVDFGWRVNLAGERVIVVPAAAVHHAEAASHGRRELPGRQIHREDRASALYVLLTNSSSLSFLPRWFWLLLVSFLRSLGFLLAKAPQEAAGEIGAIGQVLLRPRPIRRGRRARKRRRVVRQRQLRGLFAPPGQQLRQTLETVAGALTIDPEVQPSSILESGPADDDIDIFVNTGSGRFARLVRRPGTLLFFTLLVISLLAWRGLYREGVLHGGALLPVPPGASDVWATYLANWHPISAGSPAAGHPSLLVFAVLASLLLGHATWVAPLLFTLGPATAGCLVYVSLRAFGVSTRLRWWAGFAYAVNPVMAAATIEGRWGTVLVGILLPLLALAVARTCGLGTHPPSVRAAAVAALLVTLIVAVAPVLWVLILVLAVLAAVRLGDRRIVRLRVLGVALAPGILLLAWMPQMWSDPTLLWLESGVPDAFDDQAPWRVLLLDAGGVASVPLFLGVGIVVGGLAAVVRAASVGAVRVALVVAGVALVAALVVDSVAVTPAFSAVAVAPWAGPPLMMAALALIVAAALAARSSRKRLADRSLSWQQPALAVVVVVALIGPLVVTAWWLGRGAEGPLARGVANPLPAFVRAQSDLPDQIRTLVLEPKGGRLTYTLLRDRDAQLGDVETSPEAVRLQGLDDVVADLASGRGSAPVDQLAQYAVQYILAVAPVDPALEVALDSAPGLIRVANPGESSLWRVEVSAGRVRVVLPDGEYTVLPSDPVDTTVDLPAGQSERTLTLAELVDDTWHAQADSTVLEARSVAGWAQGFVVPSSAAGQVEGQGEVQVEVEAQNRLRFAFHLISLGGFLVLLVLALPTLRRERESAV